MLAGCTTWPEEFACRYRAEGYWQDITLGEMLRRSMQRHPDKLAVIDGDRAVTYAELVERSDHLAVKLAQLGLKSRDRVIFQLENSIELLYAFFALLRISVIPVTAPPAHRLSELGQFASHAAAVVILLPASSERFDFGGLAEAVRHEVPSVSTIITAGTALAGQVALNDLLASDPSADESAGLQRNSFDDAGDVALMMLSGGNTARWSSSRARTTTTSTTVCKAVRSRVSANPASTSRRCPWRTATRWRRPGCWRRSHTAVRW